MKKKFPAFIAALIMTVILGGGMLLIGQNAMGVSTVKAAALASGDPVATYQQQIAEYQAREAQYKQMIDQANQQIQTANQQIQAANQEIQTYQNVLAELQQIGLIAINRDGSITIAPFFNGGFDSQAPFSSRQGN